MITSDCLARPSNASASPSGCERSTSMIEMSSGWSVTDAHPRRIVSPSSAWPAKTTRRGTGGRDGVVAVSSLVCSGRRQPPATQAAKTVEPVRRRRRLKTWGRCVVTSKIRFGVTGWNRQQRRPTSSLDVARTCGSEAGATTARRQTAASRNFRHAARPTRYSRMLLRTIVSASSIRAADFSRSLVRDH